MIALCFNAQVFDAQMFEAQVFDAQMFINSSALSLLQNIFCTRLASMSTSTLICINANALKRF